MRVTYLGHSAQLSGGEIGLLRLLQATTAIEAHVLLAEDGPLVPALRNIGVKVEVLPLNERHRSARREELSNPAHAVVRHASAMTRYARQLRARLLQIQPDLVHTTTLKAGVYGTLAARLAGLPTIWHLHDRLAADYLPSTLVTPMRALVNWTPNGLIVPSQATLDTVGRWHRPGVLRAVIPLPVPESTARLDVREHVLRVGLVGRIAPWKGQDVFLKAFATAFPAGPVRACVVGGPLFGETDYAESLKQLSRELGIDDRVEFRGPTTNVERELLDLDLLVSSSVLPETLGQAIIEGLAVGMPIIAPDAGAPAEYLQHQQNALLHDPGDVASLAAAMRRLAHDLDLRRRFSAAGPKVASQFTPQALAPRMLDFYKRVRNGRSLSR